jgi:hypothetical protein
MVLATLPIRPTGEAVLIQLPIILPCCGTQPVATDEGDGFIRMACPVCGCAVSALGHDHAVDRWNAYQRIGVDNER